MNKAPRIRAAFTLIEVLIGVMVLALGLLGLGAIIPVIVREQRHASDLTQGTNIAIEVEKYLRTRPDLNPDGEWKYRYDNVGNPFPVRTIGWDDWIMDTAAWSPPNTPAQAYLWEAWRSDTNPSPNGFNFQTGDCGWHFVNPTSSGGFPNPPDLHVTIKLADRLWPAESSQGATINRPGSDSHRPQFVWDFIGRRVSTSPGQPDQIQVAVFVRRIDMNIRVPRWTYVLSGQQQAGTLRDVLLNRNNCPANQNAVPVCANPGGNQALSYMPTNNGRTLTGLNYSEPLVLGAADLGVPPFDPTQPNRIVFAPSLDGTNRWKLLSQPGQKLVDNLGNVYTVRGTAKDIEPATALPGDPPAVIVDPPVPGWVADPASVPLNSPGTMRQIIFTPQIPAAVRVFTITRSVP